jgi:toluene monooxygenase system protein A
MALLDRSDWYDIARDTNWTAGYVPREEIFPPQLSDPFGIPVEEWETFDEPYKVSYREYVKVQREKDSSAYSVKAALSRSKFHDGLDEGWASVLKLHYGAVALTEYQPLTVCSTSCAIPNCNSIFRTNYYHVIANMIGHMKRRILRIGRF